MDMTPRRRMSPGYAYRLARGEWNTVMVGAPETETAKYEGRRYIDGAPMDVFAQGNRYYAQLPHATSVRAPEIQSRVRPRRLSPSGKRRGGDFIVRICGMTPSGKKFSKTARFNEMTHARSWAEAELLKAYPGAGSNEAGGAQAGFFRGSLGPNQTEPFHMLENFPTPAGARVRMGSLHAWRGTPPPKTSAYRSQSELIAGYTKHLDTRIHGAR